MAHSYARGHGAEIGGFASNLWHPGGAFTLKDYCAEHDLPYKDPGLPIPLKTFADYGVASQRRFVPTLDERWVTRLDRNSNSFVLRLDDDEIVTAQRVVIAAGIGSFHYTPQELDPIKGPICSHSIDHHLLGLFSGKQVLVIGGGTSGVELATLLEHDHAERNAQSVSIMRSNKELERSDCCQSA